MIGRRRRWRQLEREKAVGNVFEAQMHARMRRQSLKHVELRQPEALDADCVTLDLGSARSRDTSLEQRERAARKVINDDKSPQWVPHSIEELGSSSSSSTDTYNIFSPGREDEGDELVLKVRQPLTQDACFRLEKLGGLDMTLAVPTFEYRVFLGEEKDFSEDATEGSRGVYRLPRLLHNSRVNLPQRSAD
ncbi:hypothetical protein PF005_g16356 [Phytophthora fragariae]|nr:hypothetical protein PF009_g17770 [Phytophthora fragariae]KAE8997034.1 hypothetical protein PF011_g15657 [Phytophthora fragariae]KAE9096594.1 hypothetical protein PF010_g16287 [Phytophthora fragariae]KAE9096836.1 hypothetical protein PF007_g16840 [Phytophthora fragariae]KAE9130690.1 hypothetical protein PF006_g15706 [Phytophthora fragariae]